MRYFLLFITTILVLACQQKRKAYDTIIRNGIIYNGEGGEPFKGDIAINDDTISFIGDLSGAKAASEIDANGSAVAPGFINMLSWATESLIEDGRSQSDIRQGVTLEVFGEGWSMGPLNEKLKKQSQELQGDIKYKIGWNTLGEYLNFLEEKGVSCNVASFVGATTVRLNVIGEDNRDPSAAEMETMKELVKQAMEEGAMGVGSSLIYPPAFFAKKNELIEMCKVAAKYGGIYISHLRSEGDKLYEALEELITISKEANIPAEVYHLKAAGKDNWGKMDSVIRRIERARSEGLKIAANMYTYIAGGTGLTATMPPALQDGGFGRLWSRLQDPAIRNQLIKEMNTKTDKWENFYYGVGTPRNILVIGFKQDSLKKYAGNTLEQLAKVFGKSPQEAAMDLIIKDSSIVDCIYFLMTEENVRKQIVLPWVSFGSDEGSYSNNGVFIKSNKHPRSYGNFARVLCKYTRDEKLLPLREAVHKLSYLPAKSLNLKKRGQLQTGNFADIIIFDLNKIKDNATFEKPHQYAEGMNHVFVNGVMVLKNGEHTGATPGRFVKGPGYINKR